MKQYRPYLYIFSQELRKLLAYRVDFWVGTAGSATVRILAAFVVWRAVYEERNFAPIGDLAFHEMLVYSTISVALAIIVGAIWHPLIEFEIYNGALTRYLMYPISVVGYKGAQRAASLLVNTIQMAVFGCLVLWLIEPQVLNLFAEFSLLKGLLSILLASVLAFLIFLCVEMTAFWAGEVYGLCVLLQFIVNIASGVLVPLSAFPTIVQNILIATPFPYLIAFPNRALTGALPTSEWLVSCAITLGWIAVFAALARQIFARGRRVYTGVGI